MANKNDPILDAPQGLVRGDKPADQLEAELAHEMVRRTAKMNDASIEMANRVKAAREFLAWSNSHMRTAWTEWMTQVDHAAKDLTQTRMALDRESKAIIAAAKDVRDFYNSAEYLQAHDRLKEMVGLLERFSALKRDGTLDAFADFILKVSVK